MEFRNERVMSVMQGSVKVKAVKNGAFGVVT